MNKENNLNYHKENYNKKQILLTSAISLRGMNFPYSIDLAGEITEHYNPKYWSNYLKHDMDKFLIPILLINEGWLYSEGKSGKRTMWTGKEFTRGKNEVIYRQWRGNFHFSSYPLLQVESCIKLCLELCKKFKIPKKSIGHNTKVDGVEKYSGIVTRSNYKVEYNDLSPSYPFVWFAKEIEK